MSQLHIDIRQLHNDLSFLFLLFAWISSSRDYFRLRWSLRLYPCEFQSAEILALPLALLAQQVPLMLLHLLSLSEPAHVPHRLHLTDTLIIRQRGGLRCDKLTHARIRVIDVVLLPNLVDGLDAHAITQGVLGKETDERTPL
jgi:hypothetical protein